MISDLTLNLLPNAEISQHASFLLAMPVLPEDRNFILLAGDGYVAGTALALILFPEPPRDQARRALTIKFVATGLAVILAIIWALGHFRVLGSAGYHALPSDHSLFAAIPLFGIADLIATSEAYGRARVGKHSFAHQRELGDTSGQLYSVALVSVYLGFWLATFAFSR